jgi:hypothetical protein
VNKLNQLLTASPFEFAMAFDAATADEDPAATDGRPAQKPLFDRQPAACLITPRAAAEFKPCAKAVV